MNLGEYLIWKATNGMLLIPVTIGLVILTRRTRGRVVFTERHWLFLFGHPPNEVFSTRTSWARAAKKAQPEKYRLHAIPT